MFPIYGKSNEADFMNRFLALCLFFIVGPSAVAQELPAARDFWYCAHFYRWGGMLIKDDPSMQRHIAASKAMFEMGASILNGGTPNKSDIESAGAEFFASKERARQEGTKFEDYFKALDDDCWAKQRRYSLAILKKGSEIGVAQVPAFTHRLASGKVEAVAISQHQEFIKSLPDSSIDDNKDSVVYSFSRSLGEERETAHHLFTKEGHPAHPGVVFLLSTKGSTSSSKNAGSYAGSKEEFRSFYTAVVLMNQGR